MRSHRDYVGLTRQVANVGTREARMQAVVDAIWHEFNNQNVSWVGFYLDQTAEPEDRQLVLGPCRNAPACSPIGLHGVCGQALRTRQVRIIKDVRDLGSNYIACDPRDRSEIVIPLFNAITCWGVLDLDSHAVAAFDEHDANGLCQVLRAAGLTD